MIHCPWNSKGEAYSAIFDVLEQEHGFDNPVTKDGRPMRVTCELGTTHTDRNGNPVRNIARVIGWARNGEQDEIVFFREAEFTVQEVQS
jgi:hypothetical protein